MLRDRNEDAGWQSHVEDSIALFSAIFDLFDVLVKHLEGLVLIILASNICADLAEFVQLLFHLFCWGLDV